MTGDILRELKSLATLAIIGSLKNIPGQIKSERGGKGQKSGGFPAGFFCLFEKLFDHLVIDPHSFKLYDW